MSLKEKAAGLKRDIPAVFLSLKHKETPILAKVIAAVTIAYALSPVDLIPDFVPVLGYLDDLIILPALVALTIKLIPEGVMKECQIQAEGMWKDGKPKKWFYAIPILVIWMLIICFIGKCFI